MKQVGCPPNRDLHALIKATLDDSSADVVLQHLDSCQGCLDQLDQLRSGQPTASRSISISQPEISTAHGSGRSTDHLARLEDRAARQPLPDGTLIGRYRVDRLLGSGGFGSVYCAYDQQLQRTIAVKVPHSDRITCPEDIQAYLAEARTVANLEHPGIVPVHDAGSAPDCPCYFVSRYVEGTDLGAKLTRQPLEYREACAVVAAVAEALHYAHEQGVVHRDVKPSNILIGTDGRIYVADFGLALREAEPGNGPQYAGTPRYMSPEQARGEGQRADGRSDVFSLGVVLYEMLVQRAPFEGETVEDVLAAIRAVDVIAPRQQDRRIPRELDRICCKALAKRPGDRYATAAGLAADLRRFLQQTAPSDHSGGRLARVWRWCGSHRAAVLSLAAGLLILVAAAVAFRSGDYRYNHSEEMPGAGSESARALSSSTASQPAAGSQAAVDVRVDENTNESPSLGTNTSEMGAWVWPADAPPAANAPFDAVQAGQHQQAWADYLKVPVQYTNSIGMELQLIPPGEFLMGVEPSEFDLGALRLEGVHRPLFEKALQAASPPHSVRITRPYYLQTYEVTFSHFQRVLGWLPEGALTENSRDSAMSSISLLDAVAFCNALSEEEGRSPAYRIVDGQVTRLADSDGYRLPREAQWEYACRAGTTTAWFFGDDPHGAGADYAAVLLDHEPQRDGTPGTPNPFGLFEMYAGSTEWCFDRYRPYGSQAEIDPGQDPRGGHAVIRGGSTYAGSGKMLDCNNSFGREPLGVSERRTHKGFGRVLLPISILGP